MAIALVQQNSATSTSNSFSVTLSPTTAGNLIVIAIVGRNGAGSYEPIVGTSPVSVTPTQLIDIDDGQGGGDVNLEVWIVPPTLNTGGITTIGIGNSSSAAAVWVGEYSGIALVPVDRVQSYPLGTGVTDITAGPTTLSTAKAEELWMSFHALKRGDGTFAFPGVPWTARADVAAGSSTQPHLGVQDLFSIVQSIVPATTVTSSVADKACAGIVTFFAQVDVALSGTASGSSSVTGSAVLEREIDGTSAAAASLSGDAFWALSGSASAVGAASGDLLSQITGTVAASGSAALTSLTVEMQEAEIEVESQTLGDADLIEGNFLSAALNIGVQGTELRTSQLSATIQGTQLIALPLEALIRVPVPYRYMRVRRDLLTRYFGGFTSDANFDAAAGNIQGFDPPNPGRVITSGLGSFSDAFRSLLYIGPNTTPSPGAFDKYSLPLSAPLLLNTVGARLLLSFKVENFVDNAGVMFGLVDGQNNQLADIASTQLLAFAFETEKGHVAVRGWFGSSDSGTNVFVARKLPDLLNVPLLLEIEIISSGITRVAEFRLFEREADLDNPIAKFQVATTIDVTVDRFALGSFGRRAVDEAVTNNAFRLVFDYVDVEPGTGVLYDPVNTSNMIQVTEAKWRPFQDRPPIQLALEGLNTVIGELSTDGVTSTIPAQDEILVDSSAPAIIVIGFDVEGNVTVPGYVNPLVYKGSLNPGFSQVMMRWYATHAGTWTLRVNSTGTTDGIEIASGAYPTAGEVVDTTWDFADLPQIDAIYDVTLYLIAENGKPTAKAVTYIGPMRFSNIDVLVAGLFTKTATLGMNIVFTTNKTVSLNCNITT